MNISDHLSVAIDSLFEQNAFCGSHMAVLWPKNFLVRSLVFLELSKRLQSGKEEFKI